MWSWIISNVGAGLLGLVTKNFRSLGTPVWIGVLLIGGIVLWWAGKSWLEGVRSSGAQEVIAAVNTSKIEVLKEGQKVDRLVLDSRDEDVCGILGGCSAQLEQVPNEDSLKDVPSVQRNESPPLEEREEDDALYTQDDADLCALLGGCSMYVSP